jgi:DNA mismatch repair protein MutL
VADAHAPPARIRALDPTLANQIAAGEVVERPASVLKELLENALDAGARRIRVEASRGGTALVRVADDGAGVAAEDMALALERHATSKIATLDELQAVQSMGFRGEALPSIASVSRLRLESRARGADTAWAVSAEGGSALASPAPAAHPQGTTVAVRDLFFNTPVRRRFLRTPRTELRHLDRVFRRVALGAFPVAMSLVHDGREVLRLAVAGTDAARRRRVARVLGAPFADAAVAFEHTAAGMRLWGWLGPAEQARERSDLQHLYVNARPVVDATVRHAVRLAYGETLPSGMQPPWLLYLELDPREVDVNVHPAKHEVRFHEARMVHDFVRSSVRSALQGLQGAARAPLPVPPAEQSRARYRAAPCPADPAGAALHVLAVLPDGLVAARAGACVLLARGSELRRVHALRVFAGAVKDGTPPPSRPLLIPERVVFAGDAPPVAWREALAALGLDTRASARDSVLVLTVPGLLARTPVAALARLLCESPRERRQAHDWVRPLAALAAATPLHDEDEARQLLHALRTPPLGAEDGPWMQIDDAALERLLARSA